MTAKRTSMNIQNVPNQFISFYNLGFVTLIKLTQIQIISYKFLHLLIK